jgi:beta-glucosidase
MENKLLWGSATASYQCEGAWNEDGKIPSMWDTYLHEKNLENGDIASDHYHRYKEDIRMLKEGGQNSYRFSLSWPRIMNENGDVNEKGISHYRDVIHECQKNNIEPLVTLYHWDLPDYLQKKGGWLNRETIDAYCHYCSAVFQAFNGEINLWTTFNEPKWFIFSGYMSGNYPPEHHSPQETIQACYNVMLANAKAIQIFRKLKIQGSIGLVSSFQTIYGLNDNEETRQAVRNAKNYCNNWVIDTACLGAFPKDLIEKLESEHFDLSFVRNDDLQIIHDNTVDFLGMNYYAPMFVNPYTSGETEIKVNNQGKNYKGNMRSVVKGWFEIANDDVKELPRNDWGMIIYPQGLYDGLKENYEKIKRPIYITENGYGNYEDLSNGTIHDTYRIDYIREHVRMLLKAKKDGVDVRGYYVWSPFDLYSWKNGCEKRYGLIAVDFENGCQRVPKESYYWYCDEIKSNWKDIQ